MLLLMLKHLSVIRAEYEGSMGRGVSCRNESQQIVARDKSKSTIKKSSLVAMLKPTQIEYN